MTTQLQSNLTYNMPIGTNPTGNRKRIEDPVEFALVFLFVLSMIVLIISNSPLL